MAVDVLALTQGAIRTAAKAGLTSRVTVTRPLPPPDPITGAQSGAESAFSCDADVVKPAKIARRNKAFTDASVAVFVAAADCAFVPAPGDTFTLAGRLYRLAALEPDTVAGVAVGYTLGGAA